MRVFLDYSNIGHISLSVANKADIQSLEAYGLHEIFTHNLAQKCRSLKRIILQAGFSDPEFIFVKDNHSLRKLQLYPAYKANRRHTGEVDIPFALGEKFLKENGYGLFCHSPNEEADDGMSTLASKLGGIIVSNDKDMWQCIRKNHTWVLNPRTNYFVTHSDIRKAFKLDKPEHIPLHKTLFGDGGDNVPNLVPRMQRQLLPLIAKSDGTLANFKLIASQETSLTERCLYLLATNKESLEINHQLVKLREDCYIQWE